MSTPDQFMSFLLETIPGRFPRNLVHWPFQTVLRSVQSISVSVFLLHQPESTAESSGEEPRLTRNSKVAGGQGLSQCHEVLRKITSKTGQSADGNIHVSLLGRKNQFRIRILELSALHIHIVPASDLIIHNEGTLTGGHLTITEPSEMYADRIRLDYSK